MPFPDKPLSHLHCLVFLSQEAPNPHFGIFSHVVGTPLQAMSVGFLQKFPHLFALLSPHCIFTCGRYPVASHVSWFFCRSFHIYLLCCLRIVFSRDAPCTVSSFGIPITWIASV